MTRSQVTSTVEQNTGGAVTPLTVGKNFLINGGFDIWARGSSISSVGVYTADRWYAQTAGGATTSQQSTGAPNGSQYVLRSTSSASSGGANYYQFIETANVSQMWGKTVTFTILLRRNSSMNTGLTVQLFKSATVDAGIAQHPGTSLSSVSISNASLPTGTASSNWYTATITAAIPNDGTANSVYVQVGLNANIATGAYYEMAQAQLEIGSVATPFTRAGGNIAGETALCLRYYQTNTDTLVWASPAGVSWQWSPPVQMRTTPSVTMVSSPYYESAVYSQVGSLTSATVLSGHMTARGGDVTITGTFSPSPTYTTLAKIGASVIFMSAEL